MKVKICGQTRAEDIRYSFECGADLCGVVVDVPSSKRSLSVEEAVPLFKSFGERLVALTANAEKELYRKIAQQLHPYAIQLTAEEPPAAVEELKKEFGFKILKSLHLPVEGDKGESPEAFLEKMDQYTKAGCDGFILDTAVPDIYGGSGKKSDWNLAAKILEGSRSNTFLAGGIGPENVAQALSLNPYGIDLASGVEVSPGVKSEDKIKALFNAIGKSRQ